MSDTPPERELLRQLVAFADHMGPTWVRNADLGVFIQKCRKLVKTWAAEEVGAKCRTPTEIKLGADDYEAVVQIAVALGEGKLTIKHRVDTPPSHLVPLYAGLRMRVNGRLALEMAESAELSKDDFLAAAAVIEKEVVDDEYARATEQG